MKKFTIIAVVLTLAIMTGGVLLASKSQNSNSSKNYPLPTELTYYWGNGCPHCENVEDFLSTWSKKDSIKMDKTKKNICK